MSVDEHLSEKVNQEVAAALAPARARGGDLQVFQFQEWCDPVTEHGWDPRTLS
jgi:hypothetical protein